MFVVQASRRPIDQFVADANVNQAWIAGTSRAATTLFVATAIDGFTGAGGSIRCVLVWGRITTLKLLTVMMVAGRLVVQTGDCRLGLNTTT